MQKKILLWLTGMVMLFMMGCGSHLGQAFPDNGKLNIVTTLFPYYDFVKQIAGDTVNIVLLVPPGKESHSFEPAPADMITLQNADIIIYNGGEMENWMDNVLEASEISDKKILRMMDYVDTVEEESVEGMQKELHRIESDVHEEEIEFDEHIWTSPLNAMLLVDAISDTLRKENPANAMLYLTNTKEYILQLQQLHEDFLETVSHGKRRLMVFADKFPMRYFADAYGLSYRAAFKGCSSDTEPSVETLVYLIDKVRFEHIPVVYYMELSSTKIAEIIREETGAVPLLFHSCHNVTKEEMEQGASYLSLMRQNLEHLKKGLE